MKKLFLLFATVTLLVGVQACKQKEETTNEEATEVVTEDSSAVTPVVAVDSTAKVDTTAKK
ncbi:MAG: hypothetical protein JWN78_2117 [Bacteroidota bacterium]|nr:hypothetical protein [Bacteroidota bacterium]